MDIKTILTCLFFINLFMGLYTLIVKKTQPTFLGINYWIAFHFFIGLGYILLSQRDMIHDFWALVVSQNLFVWAALLKIHGLYSFFELKKPKWVNWMTGIVIPVHFSLFVYFTFVHYSPFSRLFLLFLSLTSLSVFIGCFILKHKAHHSKYAYGMLALLYFVFSGVFLFRLGGWALFPSARDLLMSNVFNSAQFLSSMVIDISWTTLFFVIYNQKLHVRLHDSEEKFRTLFENNASGLALVGFDTKITMANGEFCKLVGGSNRSVVDHSWTDFVETSDLTKLLALNKQLQDSGGQCVLKQEVRLGSKDDGADYVHASAVVIPQLKQIAVSVTDISERKKAETQLLGLTNELKMLNASKDMLFSVLGHDLRSPFTTLLNLSEILRFNLENGDRQEADRVLDNLDQVANNAFSLLENLLAWAMSQEGRIPFVPQTLSFADICSSVVDGVRVQASKKGIEICWVPTAATVYADNNMIQVVIRNLLSNAVKFTESGGRIDLYLESRRGVDTVVVSDTGIGISEENIARIWSLTDKVTTRGTMCEKGCGLGLVLCKEFVEKHGGTIWAESQMGNGSIFKFTLPKLSV